MKGRGPTPCISRGSWPFSDLSANPAQSYSLSVIDALHRNLPWQPLPHGKRVLIPDNIELRHVRGLQTDLSDLERSQIRDAATANLGSYDGKGLQTVGIGLTPDYEVFVKTGLLLGRRLVLWDTVLLGAVFPLNQRIDATFLASVASGLVDLHEIIALGGAVVLPSPSRWHERTKRYLQEIERIPGLSTQFLAYVCVRAIIDDNVDLHPYSMGFSASEDDIARHVAFLKDHDQLAAKLAHQASLQDLITSPSFLFLRNCSVASYYKFLASETRLAAELRDSLRLPPEATTTAEILEHRLLAKERILAAMAEHDRAVLGATLQKKETAVRLAGVCAGAIGGAIGLASDPTEAGHILSGVGATVGVATAWLALSKLLKPSDSSNLTLYQAFNTLKAENEREAIIQASRRYGIGGVALA